MAIFETNPKSEIDCQEAYNLWEALKSRYEAIHLVKTYQNFIHDVDFKLLASHTFMELMEKQAKKFEKAMGKFQLLLPDRPPMSVKTPTNTEAFEDKFIASTIISLMQNSIIQQLRFFRTSLTNDDVRKMFEIFLIDEVDLYSKAIKYVKLKGWIGIPPMYKQVPEGLKEFLDAGEAFHLFQHLTYRYDAIGKTQLYQNFAHDMDLKMTLVVGLQGTLEKQVKMLEQELSKFGIALPSQPPKSVHTTEGKDLFEDRKMFLDIFIFMQFILDLHTLALKQSLTNDRLREIFIKLMKDEISSYNNWIKYGKIKGWLRPTPMYKLV